ncbi:MAG: MATE family efflux transporter [Deltaproteobacteria bacterium]|nr:MATE family efflux transporter [Deltaproteobacteria bacterium]
MLIRAIAVPASIGFFFNTMFNVVDTYYGGQLSTDALAALSLSFPVFFMIIALGSGIATGTTALISNAIGEGNREKASDYIGQAISFTILLAIALTLVGLRISPALFKILGASSRYLDLGLSYMNVILLGSVFFLLIYTFNAILNAQGDARTFRNYLIGGFFLNIILDPWFMYGGFGIPKMGLPGVAWATVLIQFLGTIYVGFRAAVSEIFCADCLKKLVPRKAAYFELAAQGFPASLNMMTIAVGIFVITYFISIFGKEGVAAYGIATRIEQIALLPSFGLTTAALSIVGQNNGAKKFDRVRETVNKSILYGISIMTIGTVGAFCFAKPLMGVFTTDPIVMSIGATYLRIAAFIFQAYIILYVSVSCLQGMKKPLYAIWVGLYRQIAAPLLIFFGLVHLMGLGIVSVFWGIFGITWSAALFTLWYAKRTIENISA